MNAGEVVIHVVNRHGVLYFMYYNFCRIHQTLRVTPAMEAGVRIMFGNLAK